MIITKSIFRIALQKLTHLIPLNLAKLTPRHRQNKLLCLKHPDQKTSSQKEAPGGPFLQKAKMHKEQRITKNPKKHSDQAKLA